MKHDKPKSKQMSELRKKAEDLLMSGEIPPDKKISDADIRALIHELQVYQIELEMQNEELRKAQGELEESYKRYFDLYDFAPVGYLTLDEKGIIREVNLVAADLLNRKRGFLINKSFYQHITLEDRDILYSHLRKIFESKTPVSCEIRLKNGKEFYAQLVSILIEDSRGGYTCRTSIIDVTERKKTEEELARYRERLKEMVESRTTKLKTIIEQLHQEIAARKRIEEKIKHLALHDSLTAIPNRTLFADRLTLALAHAHRTKEMLAVLFLDIDRFKVINDTLGHSVGDQLLRDVAVRLKSCLREEDTVARFAGDEFTLLLSGITRTEDVINIARKILHAVKQPSIIGRHELYITASIGIALYPGDGEDVETLMKNADTAMYHAKEQGRNNYQFYTPSMHAKSLEKMVLESNLRRALDHEQFVVYYQSLVNINTGKVVGMEALVRWRHPDRGLILPEEFLALSENTRLIVFIDELVLYTVCAQHKAWEAQGFQPLCVAVNLSAHTFQQPNLVETIMSVLQKTGLDPHFLGIEITEGIAMENIDTTIDKLNKLNELGIQISIDDFGTGFSSLYYLKKFPIHKLKISQHFVNGIMTDQNDELIVTSIISLAQGLKFKVVAEGVETEDQLIFLKQRQCDEIQGYLFCRPLPAEAFLK